MKRKICAAITFLAVIVTVLNVAFMVKDSFFYSLDNLPTGTFVREDFDQNILFSTGNKLKVYQVEASSHFPSAVRVEVCNDITGEARTIYWQTNTQESVVHWLEGSSTVVNINGVLIDFSTDTYDCRDYYQHIYVDENGNRITNYGSIR